MGKGSGGGGKTRGWAREDGEIEGVGGLVGSAGMGRGGCESPAEVINGKSEIGGAVGRTCERAGVMRRSGKESAEGWIGGCGMWNGDVGK